MIIGKRIYLILVIAISLVLVASPFLIAQEEGKVKVFLYDDHSKRDPFWGLVSSSGIILNYETEYLITDLNLEGIMAGHNENLAIINGRVVKKNDNIGQFIVEDIGLESVMLTKGVQKFELRIQRED